MTPKHHTIRSHVKWWCETLLSLSVSGSNIICVRCHHTVHWSLLVSYHMIPIPQCHGWKPRMHCIYSFIHSFTVLLSFFSLDLLFFLPHFLALIIIITIIINSSSSSSHLCFDSFCIWVCCFIFNVCSFLTFLTYPFDFLASSMSPLLLLAHSSSFSLLGRIHRFRGRSKSLFFLGLVKMMFQFVIVQRKWNSNLVREWEREKV